MLPEARPLLAPDVTLQFLENSCQIATNELEFKISGLSPAQIRGLFAGATGLKTIAELAADISVPANVVGKLLKPFADAAVIIDADAAANASTHSVFIDAFFTEAQFLTRPIFAGAFWQRIMTGAATSTLIYGWGIEFTHFVDAANEYMAAGVAHCRDDALVREWFSRHYIEEAGHSEIFLSGLASCGFSRQQVMCAPPLPSTRGLVNHLLELAIEGTVPYAAAFGVMQPSREPSTKRMINQFYDELTDMYPFAAPMFDAFRQHALIDVELKHEATVLEKISASGRLRQIDQRRAIEAARSVAEHFTLFFEGILDYYGCAEAMVPRRRARLW
jgi:pyrroloquinoline quinone (PQQ) biosynthesis protein C